MNGREARSFYKEVLPVLSADRPQIVFDMSRMQHVDSIGIRIFLQCVCQVAKNDGDIKLAGMQPRAAVVFELTRIGRLFEIYETSISAVSSFSSVLLPASQPHLGQPGTFAIACDIAEFGHLNRTDFAAEHT
jgi:anti-sigma B factor antagonist